MFQQINGLPLLTGYFSGSRMLDGLFNVQVKEGVLPDQVHCVGAAHDRGTHPRGTGGVIVNYIPFGVHVGRTGRG
jgi:hypothetical protein